jgi:hypothetical protein
MSGNKLEYTHSFKNNEDHKMSKSINRALELKYVSISN